MHIAATFQAIYYAMCQTVTLYVAVVEWFNHLVDLLLFIIQLYCSSSYIVLYNFHFQSCIPCIHITST